MEVENASLIYACPACDERPALLERENALVCPVCLTEYPVDKGIPNLLPPGFAKGAMETEVEPEVREEPLEMSELRILIIHGPNLNLLGMREPEIYGTTTLQDIDDMLHRDAEELGCSLKIVQSNHEGDIIASIQSAREGYAAIVMNPAAYTHTSIAIRDALAMVHCVKVEVHLSNIHAREEFRHKSMTAGVADGLVSGFGAESYRLGLRAAVHLARNRG